MQILILACVFSALLVLLAEREIKRGDRRPNRTNQTAEQQMLAPPMMVMPPVYPDPMHYHQQWMFRLMLRILIAALVLLIALLLFLLF